MKYYVPLLILLAGTAQADGWDDANIAGLAACALTAEQAIGARGEPYYSIYMGDVIRYTMIAKEQRQTDAFLKHIEEMRPKIKYEGQEAIDAASFCYERFVGRRFRS